MEKNKIILSILGLLFLALIITTASAAITGDIQKPTNGQKFNSRENINFTVIPEETDVEYNITNATLYTNLDGTWKANTTIDAGINGTSVSWLINASSDGNFSFNFLIYNNNSGGESEWASTDYNYSFTIDTGDPSITSLNPADGNANSTEGDPITFSYTVSDTYKIDNCTLYIDGSVQETDDSITNASTNVFSDWTSTGGDHTWYVQCVDDHANTGTSSTNDLGIKKLVGGSSNSGGSSVIPQTSTQDNKQGLSIFGGGSEDGSGLSGWTIFWITVAGIVGLAILWAFGGIILKMLEPVIVFLVSNIVGWVILGVLALVLIIWWVF